MLFEMCDVWTYVGQVGKNLCRENMMFWSLHVQVTWRRPWSTARTGRCLGVKSWSRGSMMLEETVELELRCVEIKYGLCMLKLRRCGPDTTTCNKN